MKTVFLSASGSIIKWAYTDVINCPDIEYCDYSYRFRNGIRKYVFTQKAATHIPFFIKKFLYKMYLKYDFFDSVKRDEEVLFVFTCQYNMFFINVFSHFIDFLKMMYPESKYAFYYNDIIETCRPESIDMIKEKFDLVLTFDKSDAEKYGIEYYGEVYSKNALKKYDDIKSSDVFFVGSDRGRFDSIVKTFKKVSDQNLSAVFYLFDILRENENRITDALPGAVFDGKDTFTYKNSVLYKNVYCPYSRTLAYIDASKCIVEITLPSQTAGTLRLLEATVYGKKLITNCKTAIEKPYFREENICFFNNAEDLDDDKLIKFITSPFKKVDYDFSPLKMVDYIKEKLYKEG